MNIGDTLHNGYEIAIEGELQYACLEKYKCYWVNSNELMLHVPSVTYGFLNTGTAYTAKLRTSTTDWNVRLKEAHNVARQAILADPKRQMKHILLRFPLDEDLVYTVFSPLATEKDGMTQLYHQEVMLEQEYAVAPGAAATPTTPVRLSWKVSIYDAQKRVIVAPVAAQAVSSVARLSAQITGMRMN